MPNLVGLVSGRYHIMEQLGEGGMATVYKAFDAKLERHVALKIIRTDIGQGTDTFKRFRREARALAQLTHPNIVHIHEYGEQSGVPYLVMDYLPGGTLKQKLSRPLAYDEAARLLAPIARALEYAHQQKIVHRDVKPANILLTESGAPMLTDFGLAKILEANKQLTELTATGVGVGTPDYMAPEQWFGKAEARTDVYALGIVFYELITGRRPFSADTPAAVLIRHVNDPLPDPTQFVLDLPDRVKQVLLKALAKSVDERYQTMGEFAADLERLSAPPRPDRAEMATSLAAPAAAAALITPTPGTAIAALRLSQSQSMVPPRTLAQTVFRTQFPAEPMPQTQAQKRGGLLLLILVTLGVMALLALCVAGGLASGIIVFGQRTPTAAAKTPTAILITVTSLPEPTAGAASDTATDPPTAKSMMTSTSAASPSLASTPALTQVATFSLTASASAVPSALAPTATPTAYVLAPTATQPPTPTATQPPAPTATQPPAPTATQPPTPTATQLPVPTTTQPPAPTATQPSSATPSSTATSPPPTATHTLAPTPTPTATTSPCAVSAGGIAIKKKLLTLPLQNTGGSLVTLASITFAWPDSPAIQEIMEVRLAGRLIDATQYKSSPSQIPASGTWPAGSPADHQLPPGSAEGLTFSFNANLPPTGYTLTLHFDNGCSVAASR